MRITYSSFEDINLRGRPTNEGAVGMDGSRVRLAGACAAGQTLAREVREGATVTSVAVLRGRDRQTVQSLVRDGANIARIVRVRPLHE